MGVKDQKISPKSGIGPEITLHYAGKITPERVRELDLLTKAAVDLADKIRVRVTTRQEDAQGKAGFGPFQNSGGMWSGLGVRVSNKERVNVNFAGKSAKSWSWERIIQNEENERRRANKQELEREKVWRARESEPVQNRLKAAASIGLIGDEKTMARPAFRRELLEPSEAEVQELLTIAASTLERAIMLDPLEYESYTAQSLPDSGRMKKGTLRTAITRITEKYPNLSK